MSEYIAIYAQFIRFVCNWEELYSDYSLEVVLLVNSKDDILTVHQGVYVFNLPGIYYGIGQYLPTKD